MLSLLKLHSSDKNTLEENKLNQNGSLLTLINGFISYMKSIKLFDAVLPPSQEENSPSKDLFPSTITYDKDILKNSSAIPCSTNQQPSKLLKFENIDGTISWKFDGNSHDHNQATFSNLTSPFLTSTGSTVSGGEFSPSNNMNLLGQINSPSPISISNQISQSKLFTNSNSDIDSTHSLEEELSQIPDLPNPEFFDLQSHEDISSTSPSGSVLSDNSNDHHDHDHGDSSKKSPKVYTCEYCGSDFRIRGYLTRHIKKHAITKAYECPFFDKDSENKCHPNGGFSRRDTYKTHLKARHFKYPPGTKSQDRANTPGKCGLCSKPYDNNEDWVEKHIENGECEGLPKGFQIRIKNSRKKNYEFPNLNDSNSATPLSNSEKLHDDSSSSNESGNDSPVSTDHPSNEIRTLDDEQDSINKKIIMTSLQFNHHAQNQMNNSNSPNIQKFVNDYDNNDEFSLDLEQCSFRPIHLSNGAGFY